MRGDKDELIAGANKQEDSTAFRLELTFITEHLRVIDRPGIPLLDP